MDDNKNVTPELTDGYQPDIITLTDEAGKTHSYELVDTLIRERADGTEAEYVALLLSAEDPEYLMGDGSLLILCKQEEDGETFLDYIDDDDEFDEVSSIFEDRLSDLFDFYGDDEE